MRILHVIPSLSPKQGGPSVALPLIARSLVGTGVSVDVATTDDDGPGCRTEVPLSRHTERDGYGVWYFRKQTEFYKASWPFRRWIGAHVAEYDLVHVHAIFSYTSNCAARQARRRGVPYIIRPLGVLNRWGMENRRRIIKALSFRFVEQPILRDAAAMHYTSRAEQIEAEQTGAVARAAVIPLGINVSEFEKLPGPEKFLERFPRAAGRMLVLFLSRIDVKKGLDMLLPAFAQVKQQHPNALLVIAGDGDAHYIKSLERETKALGLSNDVIWAGFLTGADKLSAFAAATVYVLPSHSENFGIALVEALAAGLPCLTTDGVAVSEDIRACDAGLVVKPKMKYFVEPLVRLLSDSELRRRLAANARKLAVERFSLETMGKRLKDLYCRILQEKATT